jgi:predicted ATPase
MPTALVGREAELASLKRLLSDPNCRLLTLVGPGGIGKTRLALEVACLQWERFAGRVHLASLASLSSPEHLVPAIAQAVGLNFAGPAEPRAQLMRFLHNKQLLLLLDNLEHLLEGVDVLAELLAGAPGLKLLVTSRERLELSGEWVFEVEGLAVPPEGQVEGLEKHSAVELFLQRARQARVDFELSVEDCPEVVRICRLVEGMPLAIELAAAWVPVLSCQEIADEIERSIDFLTTKVRDVPERQRSIRAVFDHSWQLLSEEEQHVLRWMSVFRGGFTRQAAEAVAGAGLALLSALVAKSFLRSTSEGRYGLHELVRQYVADRLAEVPEEEGEARDRHSAYYTDLVARLEGRLKGAGQLQALAEMDADIDNIRTAWRWAVRRGDLAAIRKPVRALWYYFEMHAWYQEAEATFGWAVSQLSSGFAPDGEPENDAWALREYLGALQGWSCLRLGKLEQSQMLLESSLASLRSLGISIELADALYFSGVVAWLSGDYARAQAHCLEALALAEQVGNQWDIATATGNIGLVAQALGEYEEAQQRFEAANAIYRRLGEQRMVAVGLYFLGTLKRTLGAHDEAQACFRESLALSTLVGERWIYGMALSQLGEIMHLLGDHVEAIRLLKESLILLRELGEYWSTLHALNSLGAATLAMGAYAESRAAYCEALALGWKRQALPEVLETMAGMARWLAQHGMPEQALVSAFFVLNHPAATEQTRETARQLRSVLEGRLAPDQLEAAQASAQNVPLETFVMSILEPAGV